jgi:uncharacterized membrane protein (DUF441 family)
MKKLLEPITGIILSFLSWEAWTDLVISLLVAFLGGALAYLGKWLCAQGIQHFSRKKNVFKSKTREAINAYESQDYDGPL